MPAYYNEIDGYAAQWLRNLAVAGHIAGGDVDERSIVDVPPDDLVGYEQCHFFAGIGGWSYALRLAGWPDERAIWTGSCPCQPLSSAGQRKGHADERHLWPAFYRLIAERSPAIVFGEQVAGALGREWLAGIRADLEAAGYAIGAADLCAASVGAPHIRQRLYWLAEPSIEGWSTQPQRNDRTNGRQAPEPGRLCEPVWLADTGSDRRDQRSRREAEQSARSQSDNGRRMGDPDEDRRRAPGQRLDRSDAKREPQRDGRMGDAGASRLQAPECQELRGAGRWDKGRATAEPGSSRAFWSGAELIPCLDGKARRAQPGIFPLAHGLPARVGKLRAAGNAIVPQVAAEFVTAFMECRP